MADYEHVAVGPAPTTVVIQDLDLEPGIGAFWGGVKTTVHKGLCELLSLLHPKKHQCPAPDPDLG